MTTKPAHLTTSTICEDAQGTCTALLPNSSQNLPRKWPGMPFLWDRADPVLFSIGWVAGGGGLFSLQSLPSGQLQELSSAWIA